MWVVELHPAVRVWLLEQDSKTQQGFANALELLMLKGPHLGRPLADSIVGSRITNLKELRPGSSGSSEIRALFVFNKKRKAIILIAGDKSWDWASWYETNIRIAEERFEEYKEYEV